MKKKMILPALAILLGPATLPAAPGTPPGDLELQVTAGVMTSITREDGVTTEVLQPVDKIVPGDEVVFTLDFHYRGDLPAEDVFITNPVPGHMEFLSAGPLPAGLEIAFSIDGGKSFLAANELATHGPEKTSRPAAPADYTHIRWTFARPLAPGEQGQVRYIARLQ